jgi:hypothetical protein
MARFKFNAALNLIADVNSLYELSYSMFIMFSFSVLAVPVAE